MGTTTLTQGRCGAGKGFRNGQLAERHIVQEDVWSAVGDQPVCEDHLHLREPLAASDELFVLEGRPKHIL